MIGKYHTHKQQTNLQHHKEEAKHINSHKTSGRQLKQNNQLSLPPQDENYKNSEYDQEMAQSQTAYKSIAPRGRATKPSQATRKKNQTKQPALSSPSR